MILPRWGISADEAVSRASKWWDQVGRGLVPKAFNRDKTEKAMAGRGLLSKSDEETFNDGILSARAWNDLTEIERTKVTTAWLEGPFAAAEIGPKDPDLKSHECHQLEISCNHPMHDANLADVHIFQGPSIANCQIQAGHAGWICNDIYDFCPACVDAYISEPGHA